MLIRPGKRWRCCCSGGYRDRSFSRKAAVSLLVVMGVAFVRTKWPELMGKGFWVFAHDDRVDFAMTLTLVAVLLLGAGSWSVDGKRGRAHWREQESDL